MTVKEAFRRLVQVSDDLRHDCIVQSYPSDVWYIWVTSYVIVTVYCPIIVLYIHREYAMFWNWIWNLFQKWDRIFVILTGAKHDRVKMFQNPVSRVKQTPHSTSKHWIFICERYHFYPMDKTRYFTAEHVINITLVVRGTDFYSFVKNLRWKNDPRCKL